MKKINQGSLLEECICAAEAQGEALRRGDSKSANRHHKAATRLFGRLRASGTEGADSLLILTQHESPFVRLWAAVNLLADQPVLAVGVLEDLDRNDGLAGVHARITLLRWRAKHGSTALGSQPFDIS